MIDSRVTPIRRQFIVDVLDNTPIPFPLSDLEDIAEWFEEALRRRYDVKVENIEVRDRKDDER